MLAMGAPALLSCAHRGPRRVPRIGYLAGATNPEFVDAFHGELSGLGYLPGRNLYLVQRLARPNSDDAARFADELAAMDLDLIVAQALPYALLVRSANPRMPLVIGTGAGLVCNGFGQTMERPRGIATGMEELVPGLTAKRLELLTTAAPNLRRLGLLSTTPASCGHDIQLADAEDGARRLGVTVMPYRATSREQIGQALREMVRDGQQGFVNFQGGLSLGNRQMIVDFAAEHRLPAIYQSLLFPQAGGLMSWAPDQNEQMRIAARSVARIIRGAKPGNLPITYPEKYFLTLNRIAARRVGLSFPPHLLRIADRVLG
jgi:putative ABC transport system substrate-binding protein